MIGPSPLDLVIVGTPRSGTTLVQRLVSGFEGVSVPPETHVLSLRGLALLRRRSFPLDGDALRTELDRFVDLPTSVGLGIDAGAVESLLGGRCGSLWELYAAITRVLADDEAHIVGEKTPDHLLWWQPLSHVWPDLRFVVVVRDPRAVVASNLDVPFGMQSTRLLAHRWAADVVEIERAAAALGDRCLVVNYEEVVTAPDRSMERLGAFIGRLGRRSADEAPVLHLPWETWKERATDAISADRTGVWQNRLSAEQVALVEQICFTTMRRHGYSTLSNRRAPRPTVVDQARITRFVTTRRMRRYEIRRSGKRG